MRSVNAECAMNPELALVHRKVGKFEVDVEGLNAQCQRSQTTRCTEEIDTWDLFRRLQSSILVWVHGARMITSP